MRPGGSSPAPNADHAPLAERATANLRPALVSFTNQALTSGTNFLVALVLVRWLSPDAYGAYGLGLAACFLYAGAGNAIFLTQMVVRAPARPEAERGPYAERILLAVLVFSGVTLAVATGMALVAYVAFDELSILLRLAIPVALAAVTYLLKEFFVRWAYSLRRERHALAVNAMVTLTLCMLLGVAALAGVPLTAGRALMVYGASQAAGALLGTYLLDISLRQAALRETISDVKDCWAHGRWALGGVAVTWMQSQAYAYATLVGLGVGEVGRANAMRLFISPMLLATPAVNQLAMPRYAELRDHDPVGMMRTARLLTCAMCVAGVVYSVVLMTFAESVVPRLLGSTYSRGGALLVAWCAVMCATLARDGAATLLQAMMRFRELALATSTSAMVALGSVLILMHWWGTAGAIAGTALGELVLAAILWRKVAHARLSVR